MEDYGGMVIRGDPLGLPAPLLHSASRHPLQNLAPLLSGSVKDHVVHRLPVVLAFSQVVRKHKDNKESYKES